MNSAAVLAWLNQRPRPSRRYLHLLNAALDAIGGYQRLQRFKDIEKRLEKLEEARRASVPPGKDWP